MRKLMIILAILALPTAALAQHGGGHGGGFHGGGGGFHGGGGGFHNGGGHWNNGRWIPWAIGAGVLGGALAYDSCWRVVFDQFGNPRRAWVC